MMVRKIKKTTPKKSLRPDAESMCFVKKSHKKLEPSLKLLEQMARKLDPSIKYMAKIERKRLESLEKCGPQVVFSSVLSEKNNNKRHDELISEMKNQGKDQNVWRIAKIIFWVITLPFVLFGSLLKWIY